MSIHEDFDYARKRIAFLPEDERLRETENLLKQAIQRIRELEKCVEVFNEDYENCRSSALFLSRK